MSNTNSLDQQIAETGPAVTPVVLVNHTTGAGYEAGSGGGGSSVLGVALTPWSSQPTTTVAAAADTVLKFGTDGTTPFNNFSIQNNGTINFIFSIDTDSKASDAKVYILAPGQRTIESRSGSAIHCHTDSSVSFGGDTGITVEAFA